MEHCKTCKHWQQGTNRGQKVDPRFGTCARIVHGGMNTGDYDEPDWELEKPRAGRAQNAPLAKPDEAIALDGSGYWAAIVTGEGFGCTLHERLAD